MHGREDDFLALIGRIQAIIATITVNSQTCLLTEDKFIETCLSQLACERKIGDDSW